MNFKLDNLSLILKLIENMKLKKMLAVALLAMSAMGFQIVNAQSLSPLANGIGTKVLS